MNKKKASGQGGPGGPGGPGGSGPTVAVAPHATTDKWKGPGSSVRSPAAGSSSGGQKRSEVIATKGVYANKQVNFANSAVLGTFMTVEVVDGEMFEGVFTTWSPELDIVLEHCHRVNPNMASSHIDADSIRAKMVFRAATIVRCFATDVDLDFSTKKSDGFQTDSQITRANGVNSFRELEHWEPEVDDDAEGLLDLGEGTGTGWNAEEMFRRNETKYGVTSTYKANLEGYTTQLSKEKSAEYREREEEASKIAREIEGDTFSKHRVELENGDEEEAFSAVHRNSGSNRNSSSEYRSHGRSSTGSNDLSAGLVDESGKYVPPARRQHSFGNSGKQVSDRPYDRQGSGGPQRHHKGTSLPSSSRDTYHGQEDNGRGSHGQQLSRGGSGPQGGNQGDSSTRRSIPGNSSTKDSSHSGHQLRAGLAGSHSGGKNSAHNHDRNLREKDEVRKDRQNTCESDPRKQTGTTSTSRGSSSALAISGVQGSGPKTRSDIHDLKDFHSKFQLQGTQAPKIDNAQTSHDVKDPSANTTGTGLASKESSGASSSTGPKTSTVKESSTTTEDAISAGNENSTLVKKSTLNPNAKEFNFNPNAKPFVPGGGAPMQATGNATRPLGIINQRPAGNMQASPNFAPFSPVFQHGIVPQAQHQSFMLLQHGGNVVNAGSSGGTHAGVAQYPTGSGPSGVPPCVAYSANVGSSSSPHHGHPIPTQHHAARFRGPNPLQHQPPPGPRSSIASEHPAAPPSLGLSSSNPHQAPPPPPPQGAPPTSFVQFQHQQAAAMNMQYSMAPNTTLIRLQTPTSLQQATFHGYPHPQQQQQGAPAAGPPQAHPGSNEAPASLPPVQGAWGVPNGPPVSSGPTASRDVSMPGTQVPPTPTPPLGGSSGHGGAPVASPGPQNLMINMQPPPPPVGGTSAQPQSLPTQFMSYPQTVQHHPGGMPIPVAPPGVATHPNVAGTTNATYPMISPQAPGGGTPQSMTMQHHLLNMQQQYINSQNMIIQSPAANGPPPTLQTSNIQTNQPPGGP